VSGFSYSYSGRTANGIATSYSSSTAPTAPGFYTVTATSTDGNYSGSGSSNYFISGLVAKGSLTKPADNQPFVIEEVLYRAQLWFIDHFGVVPTFDTTVGSVKSVTGLGGSSAELGGTDILYTPTTGSSDAVSLVFTIGGTDYSVTLPVVTEASAPSFALQIVKVGTATYSAPNTSVTHDFIGVPNQTYLVEYTTNLNGTWTSAGNQSTGATGSFSVTLTAAGNVASSWNTAMFFRAKVVANP